MRIYFSVFSIVVSVFFSSTFLNTGSLAGYKNKSVCIGTPSRQVKKYTYTGQKFISIEANNRLVTATRSKCGGPWEIFRIKGSTIYNPHWKTYLSCQPNGRLEGNRKKAGAWEQIKIVDLKFWTPNGKKVYALKCLAHNKFIVVEGGLRGGTVNANRQHVGNWEQFTIEWVCDHIKGCKR